MISGAAGPGPPRRAGRSPSGPPGDDASRRRRQTRRDAERASRDVRRSRRDEPDTDERPDDVDHDDVDHDEPNNAELNNGELNHAEPGRDAEYAHRVPKLEQYAASAGDDPRREALREELVTGYLPVAQHIARRFAHRGEPLDDLIQVATVGANVRSYVDNTLFRKTTYFYRVRAANSGGKSAYSNVASVKTK